MNYPQTLKMAVLEAQYADAKKRIEDKGYWGDTGYWVTLAIQRIELVIDSVPFESDTSKNEWIKKIIKKIEISHRNFRENANDPDGYGSATFHEVLRALNGMM